MRLLSYKYFPGLLLFVLAVVVGLLVYPDYGISYDEPIQREMGEVYYRYVYENDTFLNHYIERDHGSGFELPLVILERSFELKSFRDIFLMRHLVSHLFFLISAFVFYLLCRRLFKSNLWGIIGFLAIVLHPRLYAHSFFNSKDIPFMGAIIIVLYACLVAYEKKSILSYILLGLAMGYATSIRMMSILLIAIIVFFILIDIIRSKQNQKPLWISLVNPFIFLGTTCLSLYICWPTLWEHPIDSFLSAYESMSVFRWDNQVFFNATYTKASQLPWYYLTEYIAITSPILWVVAGAIGILTVVFLFLKQPLRSFIKPENNFVFVNLLLFIGTLTAIAVLDSIVYDGWRHVFFIYPSFIILGVYFLNYIRGRKAEYVVKTAIIAQLLITLVFNIKYHGFEHTYFNAFAPTNKGNIRYNFEMDYWGTTYKQGIDYLLEHNPTDTIKLFESYVPVTNNVNFLPEKERTRVLLRGCDEEIDYYITSFRGHHSDYLYPEVVYDKKVKDYSVMRVYKTFNYYQYPDTNCAIQWEW